MVSHINHNLNANEGIVILKTSKLISCFFLQFLFEVEIIVKLFIY